MTTLPITTEAPAPRTTNTRIASWIFQIVAAGILASTVPFKLGGAAESVALFEKLGPGAPARIGTGLMEVLAVALLLYPRFAAIGGALTLGLMSGAIFSHFAVLGVSYGGDASLFTMAVITFLSGAIVTWIRRRELPIVGGYFRD